MSQPCSCRLDAAESKVQRNFQQGSDDESSILSRKADPTTILNLAEQRMQSLLDKFAADKTVRLRCAQQSSCGVSRVCPTQSSQKTLMSTPEPHTQRQCSAVRAACIRYGSSESLALLQRLLGICRDWWTMHWRQQVAESLLTLSSTPGQTIQPRRHGVRLAQP